MPFVYEKHSTKLHKTIQKYKNLHKTTKRFTKVQKKVHKTTQNYNDNTNTQKYIPKNT